MRVRVPLMGGENTITRPSLVRVLKDIAVYIGCQGEPYLSIDENGLLLKGRNRSRMSNRNSNQNDLNKLTGNLQEVFKVTDYQDTIADGYENDLQLIKPDSHCIFLDKEVEVYVKPVMQKRKVTVSFEYSNLDKTFINSMVNRLNDLRVYPGLQIYHNLEYKYVIPKFCIAVLYNVYKNKMKHTAEELKYKFEDYLVSIGDDRLTVTVPDNGLIQDMAPAIRETQMSVLGFFSDDVINLKPEVNDNMGATLNFQYTYYYDEVVGFDLRYPCLVYNEAMPTKLLPNKKINGPEVSKHYTPGYTGLWKSVDGFFRKISPYIKTNYIMYPKYDDVLPESHPSYYGRMMVLLCRITEKDKRTLFNIKNVPGLDFKKPVIDMLLGSEREHCTRHRGSFMFFGLYTNGLLSLDKKLTLLANGDLVANEDLDIKNIYRVGVFLLTDHNMVNYEDYFRFSRACFEQFETVKEELTGEIADYELTNKELLNTPATKEEYYMGIMKIRDKYNTLIDIMSDAYGFTDEDVKEINSCHMDRTEMFFRVLKRKGNGFKYVQCYTGVLGNMFQLKEEVK